LTDALLEERRMGYELEAAGARWYWLGSHPKGSPMTPHTFRSTLCRRLLALVAVSFPAAALAEGCGGPTFPLSCDNPPTHEQRCFVWPDGSSSSTGGTGGMGGSTTGGTGGAGGTTTTTGGTGGANPEMCPQKLEAENRLAGQGQTVVTVEGDGVFANGECCYPVAVSTHCPVGGRPFLVGEVPRTADRVRGEGGWRAAGALSPATDDLGPELRARLSEEWAQDALFEHASVASFGRFALDLLAVSAPAELVEDAHRAALDEARHARLCLSLASAYAGETLSPGPFPFGANIAVVPDLATLAARAAREGAIGETLAAATAAEQLAGATDPAVREALAAIAEDEARHAELAWRTLAWAIRAGGAQVRAAVAAVFAELAHSAPEIERDPGDERLAAHGRLGSSARREAAARAMAEIVRPAARLLLAASAEVS
jgi:hypothetical protein